MDLIISAIAGGLLFGGGVWLGSWLKYKRDNNIAPTVSIPTADITEPEEETAREEKGRAKL